MDKIMHKGREIWQKQTQHTGRLSYFEVPDDEDNSLRHPFAVRRRRNFCRVSAGIGLALTIMLALARTPSVFNRPQRLAAADQPVRFFNKGAAAAQAPEQHQPDSPRVDSDKWGQIKNWHGICLEAQQSVTGGSDVAVHMRTCDSRVLQQQWAFTANDPVGQIVHHTGFCLHIEKLHENGSGVKLRPCQVGSRFQLWVYDAATGLLRSTESLAGKSWCLDAPGQAKQGSMLQMWECWDQNPSQQWFLGNAPWARVDGRLANKGSSSGTLPTACPNRFLVPDAPWKATQYNGIILQDACFAWTGPNQTNHIFIIGDWGGVLGKHGLHPADSRGTAFAAKHRDFVHGVDDFAQQRVAQQMAIRAAVVQPDFLLNVGDNFYWGGVGTTDDGSAYGVGEGAECGSGLLATATPSVQFKLIFEDIYRGPGLEDKQWLGVLGNHDYGGWKFTAAWDQAIGYTWRSERWMTPAQYWAAKVWYNDFSIDFYFVDTNFVDAQVPSSDGGHNICGIEHNPHAGGCGASGPVSVWNCTEWFMQLWVDQDKWLRHLLPQSTAEWQVVVTHFPPSFLQDQFAELQKQYGIDLFIAGHTHKQEVHGENKEAIFGGCPYLISGGGGGITAEGPPDPNGFDDMYGFMDLTVGKEEIKVESISHGGQLRATTLVHRRYPATTTTTTTTTGTTITATSAVTLTTTTATTAMTATNSTSSTSAKWVSSVEEAANASSMSSMVGDESWARSGKPWISFRAPDTTGGTDAVLEFK